MTGEPSRQPRRSPVEGPLLAAGGTLEWIGEGVRTVRPAAEPQNAPVVLVDRTTYPRLGFIGPTCVDWLATRGLVLPADHGRAVQVGGLVLARLAPCEALILGCENDVSTLAAHRIAWAESRRPQCYSFPISDAVACFAVTGERSRTLLSRLVDLDLRDRAFADLSVARTLAAGVPTILVRTDTGAHTTYLLLPNSAAARHVWDCFMRAGHDLGIRTASPAILHAPV